ncbi:MAG: penicillin-binding protein 2 [Gammaproteobacteria bacterium]
MSAKLKQLKNKQYELRLFSKRVFILATFIFLLIAVLILRLVQLQIFQHEIYTTLSEQNQLDLIPIEPARGLVYDRKGVLLAENLPVFSLDITPGKVKNMKKTIAELQKIIPIDKNDLKAFYHLLPQKRRFEYVPLKLNLTEEQVANFATNQWRFKGVGVHARMLRYYPMGEQFVDVIGYVARINEQELEHVDPENYSATDYIGKLGIEKHYEDMLHGQVGYQQVETDAAGHIVRVLKRTPPVAGHNIHLTIDAGLQKVAEEAMGDQPGALVAIDPSNGEVLALVSNPGYNPNLFVLGISDKAFKELRDAPNRPLYNRAIRGLFSPGSTIKPFVATGALALGAIDPGFTISDPGWYQLGNHVYNDWKKGGHGRVNAQRAITVSCDVFFYTVAHMLGIDRLASIWTSFDLGSKTGIDVDEEVAGLAPTPAWKLKVKHVPWVGGDTIVAGIGQGYLLVTPLQMANAVSYIANRGSRYVPHLLLNYQLPDGRIISPKPKQGTKLNYPDKVWETVFAGMRGVMTDPGGTGGHFGKDVAYPVAAKTGTVQVLSFSLRGMSDKNQESLPEKYRDHSWFIAFAPADDPRIAVAVIMEHSKLASPVARQVMDYYILPKKNMREVNLLPRRD